MENRTRLKQDHLAFDEEKDSNVGPSHHSASSCDDDSDVSLSIMMVSNYCRRLLAERGAQPFTSANWQTEDHNCIVASLQLIMHATKLQRRQQPAVYY
jgi:hypothetical protein